MKETTTIYSLLMTAKEFGGIISEEQLAKAKTSSITTDNNRQLKTIYRDLQNGEYDEYMEAFTEDLLWELKTTPQEVK